MPGFAHFGGIFNPHLIKKKNTTCVNIRAESIIPVHSNAVFQWTGGSKIQVLCKGRVVCFSTLNQLASPVTLCKAITPISVRTFPFQNNCMGTRTDHRKQICS